MESKKLYTTEKTRQTLMRNVWNKKAQLRKGEECPRYKNRKVVQNK